MATEDDRKFLSQSDPTTKPSMAPSRYETNRDIALLADLGMGYKKIAKYKNMPVSTVQGVVKRYRVRGSVHDAPRSGRPTKQTPELKQHIEATIQENPWASLREITETLQDLDIGQTTVSKVIKDLGFKLRIPRKKPFIDGFTKIRRRYWCQHRVRWSAARWQAGVWLDESRVEYSGTYRPGKKVRMRKGEEVLEKHLVPSFQSGRIKVNCWAAISYGSRTLLVRVRKRKPSERKTARDRLGLNSDQYATEIYESHLIPFLHSLDRPISRLKVLDDNAPYYQAAANRQVTSAYGIQKLPLPASSPDLNPIENVWHIFKQRLRRRFSKNVNDRPHSEDELWAVMEEEWEAIDQLIDSMPSRLHWQAIVKAGGSHIKW